MITRPVENFTFLVAPLRGRIRTNVYQPRVMSNRPNDAFRNRPPNTSRPPSMHVDDFIIAEAQAPPGVEMDKTPVGPPPKIPKDSLSTRGRMQPKSTRSRPTSPHSSRSETNRDFYLVSSGLKFLFRSSLFETSYVVGEVF